MTQEEFDNYPFSSRTKILHNGETYNINEINFEDRDVYVMGFGYLNYDEFEVIKPLVFGELTDLNPNA
jgi:hypothetical protein